MTHQVGILDLSTECLELCFASLRLRDCDSVKRTCRSFGVFVRIPDEATEMFRLAQVCAKQEDSSNCCWLYEKFAKLLVSQTWPVEDLEDFVNLMDDQMVQGPHQLEGVRQERQNRLMDAVMNACRPLLDTPAAHVRIFDLCLAMALCKHVAGRTLATSLYRQLLARWTDVEIMARQSFRLTRSITSKDPVNCRAHDQAENFLKSTLIRLKPFLPESEAAADLISEEAFFHEACYHMLQFISVMTVAEEAIQQQLDELTRVHQGVSHRASLLLRISQHAQSKNV